MNLSAFLLAAAAASFCVAARSDPTTTAPAPPPSGSTVTVWMRVATEEHLVGTAGLVRFGLGTTWSTPKQVRQGALCTATAFGLEPSGWNQGRWCELQVTVPAVAQNPQPSMPVINEALIPPKTVGSDELRVRALTDIEMAPGSPMSAIPYPVGAFREPCYYSHMNRSDPIVFPGQEGVSHMHTLVGNDGANGSSTYASLISTGGGTCDGGRANRTAYWMPTIVDVSTGQPIPPTITNQYYKIGYFGVRAGTVQPFPAGLKMISGDSKATAPSGWPARWTCSGGSFAGEWADHIPADCPPGADLIANIQFPACWDGVNLDSPDHKSHMAFGTGQGCPTDHPIPLPDHAQNWHYTVEEGGTANWRLSSDMYIGPGGYSLHGDWFGAWDPMTMQKFVDNCINGNLDCHDDLLGLTETLY